jgi:hypothetical protein
MNVIERPRDTCGSHHHLDADLHGAMVAGGCWLLRLAAGGRRRASAARDYSSLLVRGKEDRWTGPCEVSTLHSRYRGLSSLRRMESGTSTWIITHFGKYQTRGGKDIQMARVTFSSHPLQLAWFVAVVSLLPKNGFPTPHNTTHPSIHPLTQYLYHEVYRWNYRFARHRSHRLCSQQGFRSLDRFAEHDRKPHLHFHQE